MKRVLIAAVIVGLLVSAACARRRSMTKHGMTDVPDICKSLTPDDTFWWWWYSCGKDSAGGGGGGAS